MTDPWRFKLLYDGECLLCRREACFLQNRNRYGQLAFEGITESGFDPAIYQTRGEELMRVIHGVFPDGHTVKKVEVFREVYRAIGLGWLTTWPGLRVGILFAPRNETAGNSSAPAPSNPSS